MARYKKGVEAWLAGPNHPPNRGGSIAFLFSNIHRALGSVAKGGPEYSPSVTKACQNDFERLCLWADGLSIVDNELDAKLELCKELRVRLLALLLGLGSSVADLLARLPATDTTRKHHKSLTRVLDDARSRLEDSSIADEDDGASSSSESDSSDTPFGDLLIEVSTYVDCLLDMSTALEDPAVDFILGAEPESRPQYTEIFMASSEEALIYCRRIRDRFRNAPKFLIERFAEANVARAAKIREYRLESTRKPVETAMKNDNYAESIFSEGQPKSTRYTRSTLDTRSASNPASIFSRSNIPISRQLPHPEVAIAEEPLVDDTKSEITYATFNTTSSGATSGKRRVPRMPRTAGSRSIDCPVCLKRVEGIWNEQKWRRHLFDDLRPYVCTIADCSSSSTLYHSSFAWAQHISGHLEGVQRHELECPFCSSSYQYDKLGAYAKHASGHMREIALHVLPQNCFDDDDSTTGSSESGDSRRSTDSLHKRPPALRSSQDNQGQYPWHDLDPFPDEQEIETYANFVLEFAPDCAVCHGPASLECTCETIALDTAVQQSEQRIMGPSHLAARDWVRDHARDQNLHGYERIVNNRILQAEDRAARLHEDAYRLFHALPHPSDLRKNMEQYRSETSADWGHHVQHLPALIDYYFGLVQVEKPTDDDPRVKSADIAGMSLRQLRQSVSKIRGQDREQ